LQSTLETPKNQSRLSQHGTHSIPLRVTNVLLTEALKGIGAADDKLLQAHTKADHQQSEQPRLIKRHLIPQCLTLGRLSKGRLRRH